MAEVKPYLLPDAPGSNCQCSFCIVIHQMKDIIDDEEAGHYKRHLERVHGLLPEIKA